MWAVALVLDVPATFWFMMMCTVFVVSIVVRAVLAMLLVVNYGPVFILRVGVVVVVRWTRLSFGLISRKLMLVLVRVVLILFVLW